MLVHCIWFPALSGQTEVIPRWVASATSYFIMEWHLVLFAEQLSVQEQTLHGVRTYPIPCLHVILFQQLSIIGVEMRAQILEKAGKLPDAVI